MTWLERVRDEALRYEGAWEDYPFGPGAMVLKCANGRIFAIAVEEADGRVRTSVKRTPEEVQEALLLPFVGPAPHLARAHWVALQVAGEPEFDITCQFIARSYELVAPLKPARPRKK